MHNVIDHSGFCLSTKNNTYNAVFLSDPGGLDTQMFHKVSFFPLTGNAILQRQADSPRSTRPRGLEREIEWVQARPSQPRHVPALGHRERQGDRDQWKRLEAERERPRRFDDDLAALIPGCDSQTENGAEPCRSGKTCPLVYDRHSRRYVLLTSNKCTRLCGCHRHEHIT